MHFPSMTALRALDALARLGSVSAAADELNLTRSAVSHRISTLEERLGFLLTERSGRGVRLTARGEAYASEVRRILHELIQAGNPLDEMQLTGRLCISSAPGFSNYWLCQHIADFLDQHPGLQVTIVSPRTMDDTTSPEADVFIAYGTGDWPGQVSELLIALNDFPVCSPRLVNMMGSLKQPKELAGVRLLHMKDNGDWRRWLAMAGIHEALPSPHIIFSDATSAISAAIAAQGVAIGDKLLCGSALKAGLLIKPFGIENPSNRSYYLVTNEINVDTLAVKAFKDWIKSKILETT